MEIEVTQDEIKWLMEIGLFVEEYWMQSINNKLVTGE